MTVWDIDAAATASSGQLVKQALIDNVPRTFTEPDGRVIAGFGQRPFNPHTTRRRSAFMACDRCHSVADAATPLNEVLLDLTHGFGTQRFIHTACDVSNADPSCDPITDVVPYALDAILQRDGRSLVAVGHDHPQPARPLTLDEILRMRQVVVPANRPLTTPLPADARTNPDWPPALQMD